MTARSLQDAARVLAEDGDTVVFTGAGVSVESGIPDFRSGGGIWEKFDPMDYATVEAFRANPARVWALFREIGALLEGKEPNLGHLALAHLEESGIVRKVVTQNIDGLHQRAGSKEVVDFHGSVADLHCLWCGARYAASRAPDSDGVPYCECGRPLKPSVVLFGEQIPLAAQEAADEAVRKAKSVLVIGTSGLVEPAASLPGEARERGATVVEINLEPSALTRGTTDIFLAGSASEVLVALVREVDRIRKRAS